MRYRPEHKEESRRKVLAAAARAIREQGPNGVSVAAVMGEAGLTHGGFYAHFPSKSALIAQSIEFMFDEMTARLDEVMRDKPPRAALAAYVDSYLSGVHCETRNAGCPIAALGSEVPRLDAEARQAFARGMARRQERIAGLLTGMGMDAADATRAARSIQSELLGALVSARLVEDADRAAILDVSRQSLRERYKLDDAG
ncbi:MULTISPECIES: TetR/AcrR family transcriptional regulator [unclassified Achromobacter]|uniref:TetR/AcrR family transcriptional regulator n=1 Tax=unclassified Achromobacter TaxID=2626865 RepID=UPI000B51CE25|nr:MULTISPECIES: TetR/AcrR family transcriptional regulator [unclassified Achromobacter]OWT75758.1 TetR family transcriptional regulator [Achromobacter sp. HZ28]OWT76418.1 TetR family transcriptional regulator [Achromobacter sp. HZ34]